MCNLIISKKKYLYKIKEGLCLIYYHLIIICCLGADSLSHMETIGLKWLNFPSKIFINNGFILTHLSSSSDTFQNQFGVAEYFFLILFNKTFCVLECSPFQ